MKEKCCRSTPRCAACPARELVLARARREQSQTAALVTEIFCGRPGSQLPEGVLAALQKCRPEPVSG